MQSQWYVSIHSKPIKQTLRISTDPNIEWNQLFRSRRSRSFRIRQSRYPPDSPCRRDLYRPRSLSTTRPNQRFRLFSRNISLRSYARSRRYKPPTYLSHRVHSSHQRWSFPFTSPSLVSTKTRESERIPRAFFRSLSQSKYSDFDFEGGLVDKIPNSCGHFRYVFQESG